ncbi:DUF6000 family protein [Embleya sp. NPDC059237]|uniref:DUF6000 family protein n=1 Tax=Embleya sp. NPDC059237 TaxID=3346784 RepID=UPI003695543F
MPHTHEDDPELVDVVRRYMGVDHHHLRLGGHLLRLDGPERAQFAQELAVVADEITPRELGVLLEAGWRERKNAAWLIAIAGRTEFRDRLGELLLASKMPFAGQGYCVALASFGTSADADLLTAYLDRYLQRPDLDYDQAFVLGALLHLDGSRATDRAARFIAPGGLWEQWNGNHSYNSDDYRSIVERWCSLAAESSALRPAEPRN